MTSYTTLPSSLLSQECSAPDQPIQCRPRPAWNWSNTALLHMQTNACHRASSLQLPNSEPLPVNGRRRLRGRIRLPSWQIVIHSVLVACILQLEGTREKKTKQADGRSCGYRVCIWSGLCIGTPRTQCMWR